MQLLRVVSFRFVGNPKTDRLPVAGSISELPVIHPLWVPASVKLEFLNAHDEA